MARTMFRITAALALIGAGWSVGRAQTPTPPTPDFEISIVAPRGMATVTCVRGCQLGLSYERKSTGETRVARTNSLQLDCRGLSTPTCEHQTVSGFVSKSPTTKP